MKKWIIGSLIGLAAIGIGVGSAYAVNLVFPADQSNLDQSNSVQVPGNRSGPGQFNGNQPGMMQAGPNRGGRNQFNGNQNQPGRNQTQNTVPGSANRQGQLPGSQTNQQGNGMFNGRGMGSGMMNGNYAPQTTDSSTQRISTDDAIAKVDAYLKDQSTNLEPTEIMEFSNNFYVSVTESDTGRGAFELLVNPVTGVVSQEIGPNMMWNLQYGPMNTTTGSTTENTLTMDEAIQKTQAALVEKHPTATLNKDGLSFYGYYTFDYSIDGKTAGMLSINGLNGQVWFHTWHGAFISEKELVK